jgi:hypothetical protein
MSPLYRNTLKVIPVGGRTKTEGMVGIEETVEYRLICQGRAQGVGQSGVDGLKHKAT